MALVQSIRPLIPLVIGLAVGGIGASLFLQSMPGAEGSAEERASRLEVELKQAKNRLAALEAADSAAHSRRGIFQRITGGANGQPKRTFADGARSIAENIREGRTV